MKTASPCSTLIYGIYCSLIWSAPVEARFLQVDPVAYDDNINLYAYVGNDPIGLVDPTGQRAVVSGNMIYILPERPGVPTVSIPNSVGARGFGPREMSFHSYMVSHGSDVRNGSALGAAYRENPTPGRDRPASASGTPNNVGSLVPWDGGRNYVGSFSIPSPDRSRFTDIIVNYTIAGAHALAEGFVMGFGEIGADGTYTLHHYGEGNSIVQNPVLEPIWEPQARDTWRRVQRQVRNRANSNRRNSCHRQAGSCGADLEIWN